MPPGTRTGGSCGNGTRTASYEALEEGQLRKLDRGVVFTERKTKSGLRYGIVAAIDLEAYTCGEKESSPIRSSEKVVKERLPLRVALRRGAPLEFPHALVFYKDKKDRAVRALKDEDLEPLYDVKLMENGGRLRGWFVPDYISEEVLKLLYSRSEPCFAVADGNHSVAAAKQFWEELKPTLSERQLLTHPARFMLVELVNVYSSAIVFYPIHRLVKEVEKEAFCDFFAKQVPCQRKGDLLYPAVKDVATCVRRTDEAIEAFLKANFGKADYIHGDKELEKFAKAEDCAGIVMPLLEKDDFFDGLKGGVNYPKKTFSIGEGREKRYYAEGREISYD